MELRAQEGGGRDRCLGVYEGVLPPCLGDWGHQGALRTVSPEVGREEPGAVQDASAPTGSSAPPPGPGTQVLHLTQVPPDFLCL